MFLAQKLFGYVYAFCIKTKGCKFVAFNGCKFEKLKQNWFYLRRILKLDFLENSICDTYNFHHEKTQPCDNVHKFHNEIECSYYLKYVFIIKSINEKVFWKFLKEFSKIKWTPKLNGLKVQTFLYKTL